MGLTAIDPLVGLAIRTEACLDALDEPEGEPSLPLPGMAAHRALQAPLCHLLVFLSDLSFHRLSPYPPLVASSSKINRPQKQ